MKLLKRVILFSISVLLLVPFFMILFGATHSSGWAFKLPLDLTFGNNTMNNFTFLNERYNLARVLANSFVVALLTSTLSIVILFLASYGFSKYEFKFKKILFAIFITSVFLPQVSVLIGQLKVMSGLGIYGNFFGLVLPFIINVRTFVYLYNACFYIPNDLIEASRIDGSSEIKTIMMISLPLIKDKLILAYYMLFVASWNNFLIPMITINTRYKFTLPVMISSLSDPLSYNNGSMFLALSLYMLPLLCLFVVMSKRVFMNNEEVSY